MTGSSLKKSRSGCATAFMPKEIIYSAEAPRPFAGYSQATKSGGFIFVAGQGPFDAATGEIAGPTIQEQTRQCLRNIESILRAGGSAMEKIVSATFILAEEADFAGMNEEWGRWFPQDPPARQGAKLPVRPKGMRISISAIAEA